MPLYDTSPFSSLYGSFVDNYFTGSFLVTKTGPNTVVTNPERGPVVSVVSSTFDNNILENTILDPVNYNDSFTSYRTAVTQSKTIINKNIRFLQAISQNEYYYDSFIPDINTIFAVDDGKLVLMNNNRGDNEPIFEFEYVFGTYIYSQSLASFVQHTLTSSNGTQVSNNNWLYSFPYQLKYRNAIRLQGNPFTLSTLKYPVSGAIDTSVFALGELIVFNGINERPITVLPPDDYWNTPIATTYGQNSGIVFSFLFPSGALPTSPTAAYDAQFSTLRGVIADKSLYNSGTIDYQVTIAPVMALTASTTKTNVKFIYGFGDGFAGFGEFITDTPNTIQDYALNSVFFGSLIRGWKYGLKSGLPEQTKVLIDRNFYGGFYSMLGSRPNAVFYNNKTGQITYPIQIQFLSGTQAYVTNSNPSTLNTRESGIFDTFYRVGIPFYEA